MAGIKKGSRHHIDVTTTEDYWSKEPELSIADVWNDTIFS